MNAAFDWAAAHAAGRVRSIPTEFAANDPGPLAPIAYSLGRNREDNTPKQCEAATFADFRERVLSFNSRCKGLWFACAAFAEGESDKPKNKGVNHWRCKELVQPRRWFPFDVDRIDSRAAFDALLRVCGQWSGLAYETASSTLDAPRCRIILELSRAITRDEGQRIGPELERMVTQGLDAKAFGFDASVYRADQPCYLPTKGATRCSLDGVPVNVEAVLARVPAPAPRATTTTTATGMPLTGEEFDELHEALGFVSHDDHAGEDSRQRWLAVGMCLHGTGAPEGRELWDEWSAASTKYDEAGQDRAWQSFSERRGGLTKASIFRWAKEGGWVPAHDEDLSHGGLALRMGEDFDVWNDHARYVHVWRSWLFWSGSRWQMDDKLYHLTRCRKFLDHVALEVERDAKAHAQREPKNAGRAIMQGKQKTEWLRSSATVAAVESMARSNEELVASADQFDANLDVIGTPGGTVDLRTGKLRPAMRADYLTKLAAVTPAATTPTRWLQFLNEAMEGDVAMVAFLQRLCGYALTGHTREHKLPFVFGPGGNGKSVFANTLHGLFGDYAQRAPAEAFLETRNERHPADIASLAGARLVVTSELPARRAWNEGAIKNLTGGDPITARFMRQDPFTFTPQFTLLIVGNHMPSLASVDDAMRRRIALVPFTHEIPEGKRDHELEAKLKAEWPGILQWMVEGAVAWYRDGLQVPGKVETASGDYLDAEDELGQFIAERLTKVCPPSCPASHAKGTPSSEVYAEYAKWNEPRGKGAMTQRAFSQAMRERGNHIKKTMGPRIFERLWVQL